jgi:hypothetical protein
MVRFTNLCFSAPFRLITTITHRVHCHSPIRGPFSIPGDAEFNSTCPGMLEWGICSGILLSCVCASVYASQISWPSRAPASLEDPPPLTDDEQEACTGAVIGQSTGNDSAEPDSAHPQQPAQDLRDQAGPQGQEAQQLDVTGIQALLNTVPAEVKYADSIAPCPRSD